MKTPQGDQQNKVLCVLQETRDFSKIPGDILSSIAEKLGFMELLAFRKTCRAWRSASSTSTAIIESNHNREPWFLLYGLESPECKLTTRPSEKHYTIPNIPELVGATCVSSKQGWLLCFRNQSMFFLCPFTGAKISLPDPTFDIQNNFLAASFSSDPTSPDCIVCVVSRTFINNVEKVQCWILVRGAKEWTFGGDHDNFDWRTTGASVYRKQNFYFYVNCMNWYTFDLRDRRSSQIFESLRFEDGIWWSPCWTSFCVYTRRVSQRLGISEGFNVYTCGTVITNPYGAVTVIVNNHPVNWVSGKGVWIHPRLHWIDEEHIW